jgi:cathepsin H
MKTAAIASAFIASSTAAVVQQPNEFARYLAKFGKSYATTEEYVERLDIFSKKHMEIKAHNLKGGSQQGHNQMSDWTDAEYKQLLGYKSMQTTGGVLPGVASEIYPVSIPAHVDWRDSLKSMQVIKDQGHCGSCWAFSTIGSVEAHSEQAFKTYTGLSEQQLVDCAPYTLGCNGGNYFMGFSYLQSAGSESETAYPYHAVDGPKCAFEATKVVNHHVSGWNVVTPGDIKQLINHIAQGPVSIAIEADQKVFQSYKSGVVGIKDCGLVLDHAVLAIGYGVEDGTKYILVRNSWGKVWGDEGTVKLEYSDTACACGCSVEPAFVSTQRQ